MLLQYEEYQEMGGTLPEAEFERYELRAGNCIHRLTHGRLMREQPVRDAVKQAAWALIAAMQAEDLHGGRPVEALGNDGVSVRYAAMPSAARYAQIVKEYLSGEKSAAGTELLYAGVDA